MTTKVNSYVLDNGLVSLTGVLNYCLCQTEPATLADCTSLSGSGGKRVSNQETIGAGEIVISDGANAQSRKVTVPTKTYESTIQVTVTQVSADLWMAIYDGSRLLMWTDQITNQELLLNASVILPGFEFGIAQ